MRALLAILKRIFEDFNPSDFEGCKSAKSNGSRIVTLLNKLVDENDRLLVVMAGIIMFLSAVILAA